MSVILAKENTIEKIDMRNAYTNALLDIAADNKDVVILESDLMCAVGTEPLRDKFPEKTVNCGVQEANMVGVAAGLSLVGKIPFAHTFAAFISRRACDQVFEACLYPRLNVRLVGSDPGVSAQINGGTHMPFEDAGIMRGFTGMTVIEPTDSAMLFDIMKTLEKEYGVYYIRLFRRAVPKIYEAGSKFEIGKSVQVVDGSDVTLIASGICVAEAIGAAAMLKEKGISARVLDMFTWKPIDKEAIIKAALETGAIVTAENHNILNGLGSAVAEVLVENCPAPMERIGVDGEFGEVGPLDFLKDRFQLTAKYIAAKAEKAVARKKQ